jgi:enoyl-CoA hydratase/carnithine racemase
VLTEIFLFLSELKTCFEQLNTDKECQVIVLTGSDRAFSTGIDIQYLSTVAAESVEIDDIARKALHIRNMIQRTQDSLRAVDRVNKANHNFFRFVHLRFEF